MSVSTQCESEGSSRSRCTCRHHYRRTNATLNRRSERANTFQPTKTSLEATTPLTMEESFVHLLRHYPLPSEEQSMLLEAMPVRSSGLSSISDRRYPANMTSTMYSARTSVQRHTGLLDACNHVSKLLNLCTNRATEGCESQASSIPPLCPTCIDR